MSEWLTWAWFMGSGLLVSVGCLTGAYVARATHPRRRAVEIPCPRCGWPAGASKAGI